MLKKKIDSGDSKRVPMSRLRAVVASRLLESQIQKRNESVEALRAELVFYKNENKRLLDLVNVLTGIKENLNTGDVLDRFK